MPSPRPRFQQRDVTRAIRGAMAGGVRPSRAEIDPNGKIILVFADGGTQGRNEWDEVLK